MKKIIGLLLYLFAGILFAEQIDVSLSQGTEQSIIDKLAPKPGNPEVDAKITIKAFFNEALNPMFAKQSVSLKKLTDKKTKTFFGFGFAKRKGEQSIQGNTTYDTSAHTITFTPNKPLQVGFYEVSFRHLMTQNPGMNMRISPIVYRFYVPEVINGFKLPPEPDEKKNNETLLGIDFNDNGVRDDVERYVIKRYAQDPEFPKTKTALAMQYAWAEQKIIENPVIESDKYTNDAIDCQYYWINKKRKDMSISEGLQYSKKNKVFNDINIKDKIYNTRERIEKSFQFNQACSGHIFDGRKQSLDNCQINIDELGE